MSQGQMTDREGQGFRNTENDSGADLRPVRLFLPHGPVGPEPVSRAQRLGRTESAKQSTS